MLVDARHLDDGARLDADLCIVGAGPAGLTIARELAGNRIGVLILESGGLDSEVSAQELNEGSTTGDPYAGLRSTRHRAVGGTARTWNTPVRGQPGAKYVPLDESDFAARRETPLSGWPFDFRSLVPFYERAQRICALGPFEYDGKGDRETGRSPEFPGGNLVARIYRFGTASNLGIVPQADNVRLCHHATAIALRMNGRRVEGLDFADPDGRRFHVRTRSLVLAGGAIENARLLLCAPDSPWADNEWVGLCFMEHPRDYSMTLLPRSDDLATDFGFFDTHTRDSTIVAGRIAIATSAILGNDLPNASVTLLPRLRATPAEGAFARVRDALRIRGRSRATEGYGWSDATDPGAIYDAFRLILNVEQRPHPENRIVLGPGRDRFGLPRVVLHWRWREADEAGLERLRTLVLRDLEAAGLGSIDRNTASPIDPNAHHHAGTTRMHADPRSGVVDADGRVHGTDNLFVSGASVFPTAGFANPTLTIVALAIRLADRLASG
jgi:choline dehydrogenase-like flavoprotein